MQYALIPPLPCLDQRSLGARSPRGEVAPDAGKSTPTTVRGYDLTLSGLVRIERSNVEKRDLSVKFARKQEKPVITAYA